MRHLLATIALLALATTAFARPNALHLYLECSDGSPLANAPVVITTTTATGVFYSYGTTGPDGYADITEPYTDGPAVSDYLVNTTLCGQTFVIPLMGKDPAPTFTCSTCLPLPGPCTTPPDEMVAWYPLDEATGDYTHDILGGNDAQSAGVPVHNLGRFVANSSYFEAGNYMHTTGSTGLLDQIASTQEFSIDFWMRDTSLTTGVRTLLDRRDAHDGKPHGYAVFLMSDAPGFPARVGVQLADGGAGLGYTNWIADEGLTPGAWHHVAVTVARAANDGGRIYYDGHLVYTFDPTVRPGAIATPAPLYIGDREVNGSAPAYASLDEIEIFDRALDSLAVRATMGNVHADSSSGKCKLELTVPRVISACSSQTRGALEICNHANETRLYYVEAQSALLSIDNFDPPLFYALAIAPGQCRVITFDVDASTVPFGAYAAYQFDVTELDLYLDPKSSMSARGAVHREWPTECVHRRDSDPYVDVPCRGCITTEAVLVSNDSTDAITMHYEWQATRDSVTDAQVSSRPARHVRLGAASPGAALRDSIVIAAGSTVSIPVDVEFLSYDPMVPVQLLFRVRDDDSSSTFNIRESIVLRQHGPAYANVGVGTVPGTMPLRIALSATPNPTRGGITLAFELPRPGPVWLEVFDVTGRRVKALLDGRVLAGEQVVRWDGRADAGDAVGPGLYFARLRAAGEVSVSRWATIR